MSAYATRSQTPFCTARHAIRDHTNEPPTGWSPPSAVRDEPQLIDTLIAQLADHVAAAVAERLTALGGHEPEWMDSREAADYLGIHRDTLRKLAAERAIPAEQEGPGCKLFFHRHALDKWRLGGGRSQRLASAFAKAA